MRGPRATEARSDPPLPTRFGVRQGFRNDTGSSPVDRYSGFLLHRFLQGTLQFPGASSLRPASGADPFGFFGSGTEMGLIGMGGNGFQWLSGWGRLGLH